MQSSQPSRNCKWWGWGCGDLARDTLDAGKVMPGFPEFSSLALDCLPAQGLGCHCQKFVMEQWQVWWKGQEDNQAWELPPPELEFDFNLLLCFIERESFQGMIAREWPAVIISKDHPTQLGVSSPRATTTVWYEQERDSTSWNTPECNPKGMLYRGSTAIKNRVRSLQRQQHLEVIPNLRPLRRTGCAGVGALPNYSGIWLKSPLAEAKGGDGSWWSR